MAIGFIEVNGSIPRVQDYAQYKHNEDNKSAVMQSDLHTSALKHEESKATEVNRGDNASNNLKKFDARDKGSNEYYGDGGKDRKDGKKASHEGKVVQRGQTSSFDIRI